MRIVGWFEILIVVGVAWLALAVMMHDPPDITRPALPERMPEAQEVTYANGDIQLAGRLYTPEAPPKALLVIVHGSGDSFRDNGWYGSFTKAMVARGFAVLLPDKRGSDNSGGDWRGVGIEELAGDTSAAVTWAWERDPALPVIPVGVSQGGWIAAVEAARNPKVAAVASLSASAVRPAEQLVHEERNTMRDEIGLPDVLARALAPLTAWRIRAWVDPATWEAFGRFDPNLWWAEARVPAFIAYGELDERDNVPVATSVERLAAHANPQLRVRVYPGVGHGFFDYRTGVIDQGFLDDLAAFLAEASEV